MAKARYKWSEKPKRQTSLTQYGQSRQLIANVSENKIEEDQKKFRDTKNLNSL